MLPTVPMRVPIPGGEVPLLVLQNPAPPRRGAILLLHGLKSSKEGNLKELESLAQRGYLALGMDAWGHGERALPDLDDWMHDGDTHHNFLRIVERTAQEIPPLLDHLEGVTDDIRGRIGLCGISMGAYIGFRTVLLEPRIRAFVSILGSPDWTLHTRSTEDPEFRDLLALSPSAHPEDFRSTPVLALNAGRDENVDPREAREFMAGLSGLGDPERHVYREFPDSGHFLRETDWNAAWSDTMDWFDTHLDGEPGL